MAHPKNFDQSPEARTPAEGADTPVSSLSIMKIVDVSLRFPEANKTELAAMCGVERHLVARALSTPMALARLDSAYDVRTIINEKIRNLALNSLELTQKVQLRALEQLEEEGKVPDSALLAAATRVSLETLKGVGILKDHSIEETRPIDTGTVSALLDRAEELRSQIELRLSKKIEAEVVVEQELNDTALD